MLEVLAMSVPAAVTGFLVLAGVWVTQRHQRMIATDARAETRRDAQRRVVADVVAVGRTKYDEYKLLLPIMAKFRSLSTEAQIGLSNSETVKRLGEASKLLERALVDATLLVGDQAVLAAIVRLRKANLDLGPRLTSAEAPGDVADAIKGLNEFGHGLAELEVAAARLLSVPVDDAKRSDQSNLINRLKGWVPPRKLGPGS